LLYLEKFNPHWRLGQGDCIAVGAVSASRPASSERLGLNHGLRVSDRARLRCIHRGQTASNSLLLEHGCALFDILELLALGPLEGHALCSLCDVQSSLEIYLQTIVRVLNPRRDVSVSPASLVWIDCTRDDLATFGTVLHHMTDVGVSCG
jgi:hypothetical protein